MSRSDEIETLPVVRAAELDTAEPARKWLVEELWPHAGVGIVGGAPKCCKSWLGLDLALSVASGTPCLERFPVVGRGATLVYLAEDATGVVKDRLLGLCRRRGLELSHLPIDVITAPTVRLDLPRDQARLDQTVQQYKPRLLLLDPFVRLHRIDENSAGDVSAVLGYLRELQRRHDIAVVVVHHARKNGPTTGGLSLRGSGDFYAWVDTSLSLRRQRQQLMLTVEHRAAAAPAPFALELLANREGDDTHLAIVAEDGAAALAAGPPKSGADLEAAILQAIEQAPERTLSRSAIRATLRIRNERLGDALAQLVQAGRLTRRGDAWSLPPVPDGVPES